VDEEPSLDEVRSTLLAHREMSVADTSYAALLAATTPRLDPGIAAHRLALHRWLNAWGCRIRYARPQEPDRFDAAIASWWDRRSQALAMVGEPLARLTDAHIRFLADAFDDLSTSPVAVDARGHDRTMGPTAAAKCLYALRPRSVMPWDLRIAQRLHGGRDRDAFTRHLELGRRWAKQILQTSGLDEEDLAAELHRPGSSLAKVLDEYCYIRYTLDR
jgi:hypothetical protein